MEELVAHFTRVVGRGNGAEDALVGEPGENWRDAVTIRAGVLCEVGGAVGDLRSRRRHQVIQDQRRSVALLVGECAQALIEMRAGDLVPASEPLERGESEGA